MLVWVSSNAGGRRFHHLGGAASEGAGLPEIEAEGWGRVVPRVRSVQDVVDYRLCIGCGAVGQMVETPEVGFCPRFRRALTPQVNEAGLPSTVWRSLGDKGVVERWLKRSGFAGHVRDCNVKPRYRTLSRLFGGSFDSIPADDVVFVRSRRGFARR